MVPVQKQETATTEFLTALRALGLVADDVNEEVFALRLGLV